MKKRSGFMFLFSLFTFVSGAFVSCSDDDGIQGQATRLEVTPSSEIRFKADGNSDVKLSVKTDAESWNYEKSEWVLVSKEGNTLSINVEANTSDEERTGFVTVKADNLTPVEIKIIQAAVAAGEITLSVTPSEALTFEASGNKAVELTVKTNAKDWTYTYPEAWMTASKEGDKLTVNAKDNAADAREGEIVIKTSEGDKQVKIAVSQKAGVVSGDAVVGSLKIEGDEHISFNHQSTEAVERNIVLVLDKAAATEVSVKLQLDADHVEEYNFDNDAAYTALPEAQVAEAFGAQLRQMESPLHGHASPLRIADGGDPIFRGVDRAIVGRYHSWVVDPQSLPPELQVSAWDEQDNIMAFYHASLPVHGVQFHPESVITDCGRQLIDNWLAEL